MAYLFLQAALGGIRKLFSRSEHNNSSLSVDLQNCILYVPMSVEYENIPREILGLIESYLSPSDCAHLSATSTSLHRR